MKIEELSNVQTEDPLIKTSAGCRSDLEDKPSLQARGAGGFEPSMPLGREGAYFKADRLALLSCFDAQSVGSGDLGTTPQEVATPFATQLAVMSIVRTNTGVASVELKLVAGDFS